MSASDERRWADEEQPPPQCDEKASKGQRFRALARVGRMGAGKAALTKINEFTYIRAPTVEEVLRRREEFIHEYMHPKKRSRAPVACASAKHEQPGVGVAASEEVEDAPSRPRRAAAPSNLTEAKLQIGNRLPHAGPGRGRSYEPARSLREQINEAAILPPADAEEGNWFRRMQQKQQWKSDRMAQLEHQVEELLATNAHQATTLQRLRQRVAELERMQFTMAQDIMGYIESTPILKEAAHARKLEDNPEWALILGLGYNDTQKRNLIYQHLHKLLTELRRITNGDAMKAKELGDLLYLRLHAGEKKRFDNVQRTAEHRRDVAEAIVESLRAFVHALHDVGGGGRYPDKIRKAQQVVAIAVSKACALSRTHITIKEVADTLGLDRHMVSKCQARFDTLLDGEWEELFDERQADRSDRLPKEWHEFALQFWTDPYLSDEYGQAYNFVRRSERTSDDIRDPKDRKSTERYRIVWLEEKVGVIYDAMVKAGRREFGEAVFHYGMTMFLDLRPFYVKDATRETCMCVYHLRWSEFADGLFNYRKALKQERVSSCSCQPAANEKALRKQLVCSRLQGVEVQRLDNLDCILQRCDECKDLRKLTEGPGSLCAEEMRDHGAGGLALSVKYESYEKIDYTTKDGTVKSKKDFISKVVPFSEFKQALVDYWPKFLAHHNDAKWHDDDFIAMKSKLPRGAAVIVIDYAENYSHEPHFEHQSKYFSQVQTTIIPVVLMLRVEDLQNISEEERAHLISVLDQHGQPHVVSETHFIISSDMQHDNAMVQKALDDFIIPYLQEHVPTVNCIHVRSDGCKAQFKCAANFYWVSRQKVEGSGMVVHWSFFESCHGKCYCDPEGGVLKNTCRRHELHVSRKELQLKDSEALYTWARQHSGLQTPKTPLQKKKGRGIYRRFFYWIPSKGTGAVNRSRLMKLKAEGTSKLHEFVDIGVLGTVSTRRAACHQCASCWSLDPNDRRTCANLRYTGPPTELLIVPEAVPTAAAERMDRAALNRAGVARALLARVGTVVCIETHKDEQSYPWMIGEVLQSVYTAQVASPPYDANAEAVRFERVRMNEPILKVKLHEPLQPGSIIYKLSDFEVEVPSRSVRVIDVQLEAARGSPRLAAENAVNCGRWKIHEASLLSIRAELPTSSDDWEVESLAQYRCVYGVEQWLVKWKNYGDDRNTWEPLDSLISDEAKSEAIQVRLAALKPMSAAKLQKFTMVTLAAALASCGLSSSGQKADLVARLLEAQL